MNVADTLSAIFVPLLVLEFLFLWYMRRFPRVYITDYLRGVRFVKGVFRDVVGPGGYQPFTRRMHIEIVDMRPVPVLFERILCRDILQNDSIVSLGVELSVSDPYIAATAMKDRVGDSMPLVRESLRSVVSRTIADTSDEFQAKAAMNITNAANAELKRLGMKVSNVEITEFSSRAAAIGRVGAGPN